MSLNERTRTALAVVLLAAIVGVLLLAAPAASRSRVRGDASSRGSAPRVPVAVAVPAADALRSDAPATEAAVIRHSASTIRHAAWLARRAKSHASGGAVATAATATRAGASVRDLVAALFSRIAGPGQVGTALCVANRESHFNPYARNPYSSAAGVFQWVSRSWASYSRRYGFGGASVFNAYANIAVAAHAVADGGWGPWGGGCW
jgi:Transglycosylase SLT domain